MKTVKIVVALAAVVLFACQAQATVLGFEGLDDQGPLGTFGDNVSAATDGVYSYGSAGGWTPHVAFDITSGHGMVASQYSLFENRCWEAPGAATFTLTAAPSYKAELFEFYLATWQGDGPATVNVTVTDGSGTILSPLTAYNLPAGSAGSNVLVSFATPPQAQTLNVIVDPNGAWFGLDNMKIAEVPEPASLTLLGLGALGLLRRRK